MKKSLFSLILFVILLVIAPCVHSASHYVRSGASGAATGADWTNAWTTLPSPLIRGDTYYIADGDYEAYTFNDPEVSTQVITVKKAIEADHGTATDWQSSYGDGQAIFSGSLYINTSYYTISGSKKDSMTSGHGLVISLSTADGTYGIDLADNNSISNVNVSFIEIHGPSISSVAVGGISCLAYSPKTNLTFSDLYIYNTRLAITSRGASYITFENNYIGPTAPKDVGDHGEAWSDAGSSHVTIRNCVFQNIFSTTAVIAWNLGQTGSSTSYWDIYGNVSWNKPGVSPVYSQNGFTYVKTGNTISDMKIYNNAFVNIGSGSFGSADGGGSLGCPGGTNVFFYNNIFYYNRGNAIYQGGTSANNWFYYNYRVDRLPNASLDASAVSAGTNNVLGSSDPFVDWQNGDFRPNASTTAINAGKTLTTGYDNIDPSDSIRGSDGYWDIGTYEAMVTGSVTTTITGGGEDGMWRIADMIPEDSWHESGYTKTGIIIGSHTVEFQDVYGWNTPADDSVTVSEGATANASGTYTAQTASITVTMSSENPTGSGWSVDGGSNWNASGATLSGLYVYNSPYTITFKTVTGYTKPSDITNLYLTSGQTASYTVGYTLPVGDLIVYLDPEDAVNSGAQWRRVGTTPWFDSGETEENITAGDYDLEFKDVTGWDTPANIVDVTISAGETTTVDADTTYVRQTGSLTVTISPAGAVTAGAQWRIVGDETWQDSAATQADIPTGTYIIEFHAATGYVTPNNIAGVVITDGGTTELDSTDGALYVEAYGSLSITFSPNNPTGAHWAVDGGDWQDSGDTVTDIDVSANPHTITYATVSDYTAPATENFYAVADTLTSWTKNYVPTTPTKSIGCVFNASFGR